MQKVQKILDEILNAFETGNVPQALATITLPRFDVPSAKWSLTNRLIAFFSGTSDARGFKQWQEVGRYPKKGSKAVYILSPRQRKITEDEEEKTLIVGFVPIPVFRVEDTDGEELNIPSLTPPTLPPLIEVARAWDIKVKWESFQGEAYGYYSPGRKEIVLATHDIGTFFHELGHAAHERVKGSLKGRQDWQQEIVAELTAATLSELYGQPNTGGSYRYIKRYAEEAKSDPHKACLKVISDVQRCLEEILQQAVSVRNRERRDIGFSHRGKNLRE